MQVNKVNTTFQQPHFKGIYQLVVKTGEKVIEQDIKLTQELEEDFIHDMFVRDARKGIKLTDDLLTINITDCLGKTIGTCGQEAKDLQIELSKFGKVTLNDAKEEITEVEDSVLKEILEKLLNGKKISEIEKIEETIN